MKLKGYLGNPNLKDVGQHINYTPEQVAEYIKCKNDLVYFASNYIKIVNLDKGLMTYKPYAYQNKLLELVNKERFVIVRFPRQSGKSTTIIAYFLWYVLFNSDVKAAVLANKASTAKELLSRFKKAYELLPKWLQQGVTEWNKFSVELENGSKIMSAATSSSAIRGESYNCVTGDTLVTVEKDGKIITLPIGQLLHNNMQTCPEESKFGVPSIDNKYFKLYYQLIEKRRNNSVDLTSYYETHHIIPKCFGGTNDESNLVRLTAREHYIAHRLMIRFLTGKEKAKMVHALHLLVRGHQNKYFKCNSRMYEKLRIEYAHARSLLRTGEKHSDETKLKIGNANKGRMVSDHTRNLISKANKGKLKGLVRSLEFREKLRVANIGKKKSKDHSDKINKNPEKIRKTAEKHRGMKRSSEAKKSMSIARQHLFASGYETGTKGRVCYYNETSGNCIYRKPDDANIPEGYRLGGKPNRKRKTSSVNSDTRV